MRLRQAQEGQERSRHTRQQIKTKLMQRDKTTTKTGQRERRTNYTSNIIPNITTKEFQLKL